ncbi:uncharacterized protein LOC106664928 [Cimex lectularius]|uniref:Uncharacterized protein n=1 Tax=Cimex lectularius TaxID=79782 RepID=A0A8I6RQV5_CIMLE|nr:uncharacterized protein LOC106664928 [Cimex lectularius]
MGISVIKVAVLSALLTVTAAFSSSRRNGENDELEDTNKQSGSRWYIVMVENFLAKNMTVPSTTFITEPVEGDKPEETEEDPDPLSVVWYLGAFGGLIAFFLVVTFSEWCCASKHLYRRQALPGPYISTFGDGLDCTPRTPPPPYHLFAPPPYEVVSEKQFPILIIPVHKPTTPPPPQV